MLEKLHQYLFVVSEYGVEQSLKEPDVRLDAMPGVPEEKPGLHKRLFGRPGLQMGGGFAVAEDVLQQCTLPRPWLTQDPV